MKTHVHSFVSTGKRVKFRRLWKNLFRQPSDSSEDLLPWEQEMINLNKCPDCSQSLKKGPSGTGVNVACSNGHKFNLLPKAYQTSQVHGHRI